MVTSGTGNRQAPQVCTRVRVLEYTYVVFVFSGFRSPHPPFVIFVLSFKTHELAYMYRYTWHGTDALGRSGQWSNNWAACGGSTHYKWYSSMAECGARFWPPWGVTWCSRHPPRVSSSAFARRERTDVAPFVRTRGAWTAATPPKCSRRKSQNPPPVDSVPFFVAYSKGTPVPSGRDALPCERVPALCTRRSVG